METRGTTGEETISYWFDLPIDVAEFEEKLGIGAESGDYRIIVWAVALLKQAEVCARYHTNAGRSATSIVATDSVFLF